MIDTFLGKIYGDSIGLIDIVTQDEDGTLSSERWFNWPKERATVALYIGMRHNEDVYASVGVFAAKLRTKDDPDAVTRAVYADADTCAPSNFRLPPSIVVQTSAGRWHCWWLLDTEVPAKLAAEASRRIYLAHADQGCDRGWIESKILRVPGTSNTKREVPEAVTAEYSDEVYTLDTINDVYGDIDLTPSVKMSNKIPEIIKDISDLEERLEVAGLSSLYLERPLEGQSWSERLFRLELELFRCGMTAQEVFSVARESACNKYAPANAGQHTQTGVAIPKRNDPDLVLWKDVQKAQAEFSALEDVPVEDLPQVVTRATFLSFDERKFIVEHPSFIDEYVKWVASITDSAETYQRTLAYMLLSSVYGDRGYIPTGYGGAKLNLWALILGDTTWTRKTTAKTIYLRALRAYERYLGVNIDIGSNVTAEALLQVLGDRDGQVSVLHTDEVNGFFRENYMKNYRVGTLETFTELYEGQVPVVLRATKGAGNRQRASCVFNFIGVGIRAHTAEVLSKEHFESGFLARMLWAVADPPPRRIEDEHMLFQDGDDCVTDTHDPALTSLVQNLVERAGKWDEAIPTPVKVDLASQRRFNQWTEDMANYLNKHYDAKILTASAERLKWSVRKAASLLALHDGTDTVTFTQLLPALAQAELWFNDMLRMASEVSSSEFERRCDELENFIVSGEARSRQDSSVRRKFAYLKPQEYDEAINTLRAQGRIRKSREVSGKWEALG